MFRRALNVIKYALERLLLRGTPARLLVIAAAIGLVSLAGGWSLVWLGNETDPKGAVWWAFLRLTDPGYLGDDEGSARRVVSTLLTVAGYVLFMGSLVAIMTQWLDRTIRNLERGLTPIAQRGHLVVVGMTSRTPVIAREMFQSLSRVRRFLSLYDARVLRLVFLLEDLDAHIRQDLRRQVGDAWRERRIAMRSGSALVAGELARADVGHAAAILIPADDMGVSESAADAATVKALLSVREHLASADASDLPVVVSELFDAERLFAARRAYPGPLELVCSDRLMGRVLALTILNPGLARVVEQLLAYGNGSDIHIIDGASVVGCTIAEVRRRLPNATCLGLVRPERRSFRAQLCPSPETEVREKERLVVLALSHDAGQPLAAAKAQPEAKPLEVRPRIARASVDRVLVVGWSDRVPDLLAQLQAHHPAKLEVAVLSALPVEERAREVALHVRDGWEVRQLLGNITRRAVISEHLGHNYDRIVLVASDRLGTGAQSDARGMLTYLLVRDELVRQKAITPVIVELMDDLNRSLFRDSVDVVVSPTLIGRVLAHVALRRELRAVYDEIFGADGPSIALRQVAEYGLDADDVPVGTLAAHVAATGDIFLGLVGAKTVKFNPAADEHFRASEHIAIAVLSAQAT